MKRIVALVLGVLPLAALAAPPTDASIRKLLEVSHAEATMNQVQANMQPVIRKLIDEAVASASANHSLNDEQKRILAPLPERFAQMLREEFGPDKLLPHVVDIYRDTYDQTEIDGLIAFYQSPVGQSYARKAPVAAQKTAQFLVSYELGYVLPKIKAQLAQVQNQLKLAAQPGRATNPAAAPAI
ncbi:MAG: DUF2059 domain-containing protein [Burkholderiaceae bacterium]|jgi:hypothetical protein|nr:DUF2059 domain-containing protein [Burkholderiaceae bacterium]